MKKQTFLFSILIISTIINAQDLQWVKTVGGLGDDVPVKIITDPFGNVYNGGYFEGTIDLDPGSGTFNVSSNGSNDTFITKLDPNGNLLWAKSIGGISHDYLSSISIDNLGNIYLTGGFQDTVDFDPGSTNFYITSNGELDVFILKLSPEGNFIWAKTMGSILGDGGGEVFINEDNELYITGHFSDTIDFDPGTDIFTMTSNGEWDFFVLKLDSNGDFLWVKTIGGEALDSSVSISRDNSGNILIAGYFSEVVDFDPGAGTSILTAIDGVSFFALKLDSEGEFMWARSFGSSPVVGLIKSLSCDLLDNVYITGGFRGTVDFDPGVGVFDLTAPAGGFVSGFVQKLDSEGVFQWAFKFGDNYFNQGWSITTDVENNIFLTGKFWGTVDFDPGVGTANLVSNGDKDVFIAKYNSQGNYIWAKPIGGLNRDVGTSIYTDGQGELFLTGTFRETADLNPGSGVTNVTSIGNADVFIMKLTDNTLGVEENDSIQHLSFSPNPTNGNISLLLGQTYQKTEITITSILGKTILKNTEYNTDQIDVNIIGQSGVYLANVILDGKIIKTIKIIKN